MDGSLLALLRFDAPAGAWVELDAWLMRGELMLHQHQVLLMAGVGMPGQIRPRRYTLRYGKLPLLPGLYGLAVDVRLRSSGRPLLSETRHFTVRGGRAAGGGIVHQPSSRRVTHAPGHAPQAYGG